MPLLMTIWTQIRVRPMLGIIAKQMKRCPVMFSGALFAAGLADKRERHRVKLLNFNTRALNSFALCIPLRAPSAASAHKRVSWFPGGIGIETYPPTKATAMLAAMRWVFNVIFPRGVNHEAMPFLR